MIRLGVLGSTRGTHLTALMEAIQQKRLSASIEIVLSNKSDMGLLKRAEMYGLVTQFIDPQGLSREQYDRQLSSVLSQHAVELVVLMGYMRILSAHFITQWENKIINVHPSLLPAFAGKMDLDVHRAVITAGMSETGCTVHYVTSEVDAGLILLQKTCPVYPSDTPERLKQRVQELEGVALVEVIQNIIKVSGT